MSQFAFSGLPRKTGGFGRVERDRREANCDKILAVLSSHELASRRCGSAASMAAFASGR